MPRLTAEQKAEPGLGATTIAAIAGVSPWMTPFDAYLEQIGELDRDARDSQADRDRKERGHRLEDVCLDWYAERYDVQIERVRRTIHHPTYPFIRVHPDARVRPWRQSHRLVEAKTAARKWDEVPRHVEAQVQVQMAVTGAQVCDVAVLGFDGPPARFEVERNDELIDALTALAVEFWDRVQRRDPPPMDGSRAASRWLDGMFREAEEIQADADQARVLARILAIRAETERLEAEDRELVNVLKFSMAGASRLYARGVGSVLWTVPAERRTVAWKDVAAALRVEIREWDEFIRGAGGTPLTDEELDGIVERFTKVDAGVRQFRVSPPNAKREAA